MWNYSYLQSDFFIQPLQFTKLADNLCVPQKEKQLSESCCYVAINGFRIKHVSSLTRGSVWCIPWSRTTKWEVSCRTLTAWTWWTGASLPAHSHSPGRHDEFQSCVKTQPTWLTVIFFITHQNLLQVVRAFMLWQTCWTPSALRAAKSWLCLWAINLLISVEMSFLWFYGTVIKAKNNSCVTIL